MGFVFGSIAKHTDSASSDIDVLIVSDTLNYAELFNLLETTSQRLGRPVNPTLYHSDDVTARTARKNAFIDKIFRQPKLWISGASVISPLENLTGVNAAIRAEPTSRSRVDSISRTTHRMPSVLPRFVAAAIAAVTGISCFKYSRTRLARVRMCGAFSTSAILNRPLIGA